MKMKIIAKTSNGELALRKMKEERINAKGKVLMRKRLVEQKPLLLEIKILHLRSVNSVVKDMFDKHIWNSMNYYGASVEDYEVHWK